MRARVSECRLLATCIGDEEASAVLRRLASEGEQDIQRILAERSNRTAESRSPEA